MSAKHQAEHPERWLALCFLCLGVAASTDALHAQGETGTIAGQLVDWNGDGLSGVSIAISNTGNDRIITIVTDASGRYRAELEPGTYSLHIDGRGAMRRDIANVRVTAGARAEVVEVTADSTASIDTSSTQTTFELRAEEIGRLPASRSFQALARMAPSVNSGDIEGGFQANGASGAENAFTIDGVRANSVISGAARQTIAVDFLQEIDVTTTGIAAEFDGAIGGTISAISKSGGNTFHGEGHYYFSGSALSAKPVKRLVLNPADNRTVGYVQDGRMPGRSHEIGGSLGGPLVKNRLWFLGAISPTFEQRTNVYLFSSGKDPGDIHRRKDAWQVFGKTSYAGAHVALDVALLRTPERAVGALPNFDGFGRNFISSSKRANEPNAQRGFNLDQTSSAANVSVVPWTGASLTFRGSYFRDSYKDTGISAITSYTYQTPSSNSALSVPSSLAGPIGAQNTPRSLQTLFDTTIRATSNAAYGHNFRARGLHLVKGGFGFERTINRVNSSFPGGYVNVYWGGTFLNPNGTSDAGAYGYYEVHDAGLKGSAGADTYTLFVQDEWSPKPRLTLNAGLRSWRETLPSFRSDIQPAALTFAWLKTASPRLSVRFALGDKGRVVLSGDYGRYYDWTKYAIARESFGGKIWRTYYRAIDDPNVITSASLSNMPGRDLWQGANRFRDNLAPAFNTIDPEISPTSQDSIHGGVEMQSDRRGVFGIHFIHNDLRRAIEDVRAEVDGKPMYLIGNPGEGRALLSATSGLTAPFLMPKPERRYDAFEFTWRRRVFGNWFAGANYTLSRLCGNYAGLANSDEIRTPTTGGFPAAQRDSTSVAREGGNLNSGWDIDEAMWDAHGHLDVKGLLATDRPHVIKLFGSYTAPFGTTFGGFQYAGSGTPITTYLETSNQTEVFVNGRGDLGRSPFLTQTDLLVSHDLKMTGNRTMRFELNVLNVFNQKTARHVYNYVNRGGRAIRQTSAVPLGGIDLARGYDYNALILATPDGADAFDPRYKMPDLFNPPLQAYVMAKFLF